MHDERKPMSQQRVIKILSVDDHHLIREGIATVIGSQIDMKLIAHASSGIEAIQLYRHDNRHWHNQRQQIAACCIDAKAG